MRIRARAVEQRDIGRSAAHVEGDEAIDARSRAPVRPRRRRPPPAPRESCAPVPRARARRRSRCRWIASRAAARRQAAFEIVQMGDHPRRDVGVDRRWSRAARTHDIRRVSDARRKADAERCRARARSHSRCADWRRNGAGRPRTLRRRCARDALPQARQFVRTQAASRSCRRSRCGSPTPKRSRARHQRLGPLGASA